MVEASLWKHHSEAQDRENRSENGRSPFDSTLISNGQNAALMGNTDEESTTVKKSLRWRQR